MPIRDICDVIVSLLNKTIYSIQLKTIIMLKEALPSGIQGAQDHLRQPSVPDSLNVIGIRPLAPVQNSVSLKLMQRKTLNFVINLPGIENITK